MRNLIYIHLIQISRYSLTEIFLSYVRWKLLFLVPALVQKRAQFGKTDQVKFQACATLCRKKHLGQTAEKVARLCALDERKCSHASGTPFARLRVRSHPSFNAQPRNDPGGACNNRCMHILEPLSFYCSRAFFCNLLCHGEIRRAGNPHRRIM